jgi:hypothetical protein
VDFMLGVVPCFVAGTRIATARGMVAVENLRIGDVVHTRDGTQPIVWIGHRRLDISRHPDPEAARPIRIARHAFAPGVPVRDLLVSPDHAIFHDGALVPAKLLLNRSTITQARPRAVTYYNIELLRHDILYAENLPAESYLDTGNRGMFENADTAFILHPAFAIHAWDDTCAPMVLEGKTLAKLRRHLLARAKRLGHAMTKDPGLHLLADGRRLDAQPAPDGTVWVAVPEAARRLRLVSRSAVPAQMLASSTDRRRLGVCVQRIEVITPSGRHELDIDDPTLGTGWHAQEKGWRWTDGHAAIDVQGPAVLVITLAGRLRYPELRLAA